MKNPSAFEAQFASDIQSTLSCHDRVIFKGHLFHGGDHELNRFVDYTLGLRRMDFIPRLRPFAEQLVEHAKRLAAQANAPYRPPKGKYDKEKFIDDIDHERRHPEGLLAVLCVIETSRAIALTFAKNRPKLIFTQRPQRVLYYYFNHPDFGRIHVRIGTWFPFSIQVYVNGHDWLAHQMAYRRLGFVQEDNAFTQLDRPDLAQRIANLFPTLDWERILDRWARPLMPVRKHEWFRNLVPHWVIDQCEYSTDLLFRSPEALARVFPSVLHHALTCFSAQDVLAFLGRRLHSRFDGEVLTDCKKDRYPGARIKHRVKGNWIKMYDKLGRILRIETVINQPSEFHTLRWGTQRGQRTLGWFRMAKGIRNFPRFTEVAQQANRRYLNALAAAKDLIQPLSDLELACRPVGRGKHRRRALQPLLAEDQNLFRAAMRGDHLLHGFRNKDIVRHLFPAPASNKQERTRRSAHVGRRLRLLRAHRLIRKAPRARKYYLTPKGSLLMAAAISLKDDHFPKLIQRIKQLLAS